MTTSHRIQTLALATSCAAALSSCSFSLSIGSSEDEKPSPAAVAKQQTAVGIDAADLSRAVRGEVTLGEADAPKKDTDLDLPTSGALPASVLDDLGVTLGGGNAAYVLDFESRSKFTVCVDRDGKGPSVTHENTAKKDIAIASVDACQ